MKADLLFYPALGLLVLAVLGIALVIPNDSSTTMREEARELIRVLSTVGRRIWSLRKEAAR